MVGVVSPDLEGEPLLGREQMQTSQPYMMINREQAHRRDLRWLGIENSLERKLEGQTKVEAFGLF